MPKNSATAFVLRSSWGRGFLLIAGLILAQLGWWSYTFVREAEEVAAARRQAVQLEGLLNADQRTGRLIAIDRELLRRKNMFLSESIFFAGITLLGLTLLFRALRAERRAQQQEKSFIQIVTHESKTPLTSLQLRLESISERWSGRDPELTQDLEAARDDVRRLAQVVEKSINLNRLEREGLTCQSVCLTELLRDLLARLQPFFRAHKVQLQLELEEEVWLYADASSLVTSLQNLLENAVVYNNQPHPQVEVRLSSNSQSVQVVVADNGPGIAASEREGVFQRFKRGKSSQNVPGMGLGLYLARAVVEAHGGALTLAPAQPRGTVFEMRLPIGRISG